MPLPQNRNRDSGTGLIPPQAQPVRKFTTPSVADGFFSERIDVSARDYVPLVRGTPYATIKNALKTVIDQFPTLYFVKETLDPFYYPWALRLWATDENAESTYNAEIGYLNENVAYPSYSRVYTLRREQYEASPSITPGTPFTGILSVRVDNGGTGYTNDDAVVFASGSATAVLVVDDDGAIINIVITDEGSGYDSDSPPAVTINSPNDGGAVLTAIMQDKSAVLTSQKKVELADDDPLGFEKVRIIRVYETLPGPFDYSTRLDPDGVVVAIGTRRNIAADINSGESANSNIWIKRTKKGDQNSYVADEVVETRALPGNSIPSVLIGQDLYGAYTGRILDYGSDILPSVSESGGVLTTVEKKDVTEAVSEQITTTKKWVDDADFSITIPNLIPAWARARIPTTTVSHKVKGTASQPVLGIGEFTRAEKQIDAVFKRVTVESLDLSLVELVLVNKGLTEKFGGSTTTITVRLNLEGTFTIDQGYLVLDSRVDELGNGLEVKTTEAADAGAWMYLYGQDYDESLDVVIPFLEKTTNAGSGEIGTPKTDIKPDDIWRSKKRTIDATAAEAVLGAYLMAYPSKINISMPDKLVSLTAQIESQTGSGSDSETGNVTGVGSYSISLDLRADATASATIMPEVVAIIKQFYGANINCTHYIFFLPNPVTAAQVVAKINDLISGSVSDWPKFNPQTLTMLIVGANAALKVNAVSKGSYSQTADLTSVSSTTGGGTGYSRAKGLTLRRMEISPTIHGELTVGGVTSDSVDLAAYCGAEAVGLGPLETINQTDSINAFTSPTSFSATDGATDWPSSGKFLYRVDGRPYKYGFVMFHAIVVDAADFPSA
jgi:hypothetical protein